MPMPRPAVAAGGGTGRYVARRGRIATAAVAGLLASAAAPLCWLATGPASWRRLDASGGGAGALARVAGRAAVAEQGRVDTEDALDVEGDMEDVDDELDVEGDLEDDWQLEASQPERPEPVERFRQQLGMSEEEAQLWEKGAETMFKDGAFPQEVRDQLQQYASNDSLLETFKNVQGSGHSSNWMDVAINDSWVVRLSQVPGATANFIEMFRTETEATEETMAKFHNGDTVWPSAIVLARWLVIQPPLVEIEGKKVVELGAGLGLPSIVAARLGAASVLIQDFAEDPLRQALETASAEDVIDRITTLRCSWKDLPNRLLSASEEVLQTFAQADVFMASDVILNEGAATDIAEALSRLLQGPDQVAHIIEPYKRRRERRAFVKLCKDHGLEVLDREIITWEPEAGDQFETEAEWVSNLITLRRA